MKKFMSAVLVSALLFSFSAPLASAQQETAFSEELTTTEISVTEETESTEVTFENTDTTEKAESESPSLKDDDDVVGKIYLCTRWSNIFTTGHLWIYIVNTDDEMFTVGCYELQPGEGVSLATFGFTRSDGMGLYYNMEAYRNDKYCDDSCYAISDTLTRKEQREVSEELLNQNRWNIFRNCVYFACDIWNMAGNRTIIPFFYPPLTRLQILTGGKEKCIMEHQPGEKSFKHYGKGKDSYMKPVSQASLDD